MKPSDVLRKAGDILRERGWCQGVAEDKRGRVGVLGALGIAENGVPTSISGNLYDRIAQVVEDRLDKSNYNDTPGRTASEVMQAIDAAYVVALQEEGENLDEYEVL